LAVHGSALGHVPPRFARVELAPSQLSLPNPMPLEAPVPAMPSSPRPDGLIEIQLPGGVSLRVDAHLDGRALRRVLGALEGR
jgi:hypothetical protein